MMELPRDITVYREYARRYLDLAVNGDLCVTETSPIYQAVVERRDPGPVYSSCGDLAHWLWYRLGIRAPWVNRQEHRGFRYGVNISILWKSPWRDPIENELPAMGDMWLVWDKPDTTDAHVILCGCVADDILHSYEYGQAAISRERWRPNSVEGRPKSTGLLRQGRVTRVGGRQLRKVLTLETALRSAYAEQALVEPQDPDEWLAGLGLSGSQPV